MGILSIFVLNRHNETLYSAHRNNFWDFSLKTKHQTIIDNERTIKVRLKSELNHVMHFKKDNLHFYLKKSLYDGEKLLFIAEKVVEPYKANLLFIKIQESQDAKELEDIIKNPDMKIKKFSGSKFAMKKDSIRLSQSKLPPQNREVTFSRFFKQERMELDNKEGEILIQKRL